MSRQSHFVEGVLFGAIIGFVSGLLLAPESGEDTRKRIKKIKDDNEDLINDTKEKTETMIAKTLDAIDQGFEKLTHLVEEKQANGSKEKAA